MRRNSIRYKLFFIIAVILLFNLLVTLLFGHSLMEKFYIENKKSELKTTYHTLINCIVDGGSDIAANSALSEEIFNLEKGNITLLLFTLEDYTAEINYYSRGNRPEPMLQNKNRFSFSPISHYSPEKWIEDAQTDKVFESETVFPILTTDSVDKGPMRTLELYGKINDQTYLFLSTPQEPLKLAASLGVQYNLYISLATFFLAAILVFFVSKRFTKPISDIDAFAKRISQMDFSQQCDIKTGDELEELSSSINIMAEKLRAYIEQMQLNQTLLQKDLEREAKTNLMRKEFITNVSHDFKTPLTLIRAYAETLKTQSVTDAENLEYCTIILQEIERMTTLVTELLQLSKLESGIIMLEESLFPIDEMMRDILHHHQILIKDRALTIDFRPTDDYFVYGDYVRIEQVLSNLIENAIKYCPPDGLIIFTIDILPEKKYRICITNSGEPIPDDQLESIFISFYKQDQSRKSEEKSFGLGLAIVKAIITLHHQNCGACNTESGIQFWFELPSVDVN